VAKVDAKNGFRLDLSTLDFSALYQGTIAAATSTIFQVSYGGGYSDTFRGSGFTYSFTEPTGGLVTSYLGLRGGYVALTITGIAVSVPELVAVGQTASTGDDYALFRSKLAGADKINGSWATDVISGFGGADTLNGREGDDKLNGGAGNDVLIGGRGRDSLFGSSGADRFRFDKIADSGTSSRDLIRDFKRGVDKIDLSRIDADQDGTSGNQAFKFIGSRAFTGQDGELRFASGSVYGDVNGDGFADFAIRVAGLTKMAASDFVL
jgi:serralysin